VVQRVRASSGALPEIDANAIDIVRTRSADRLKQGDGMSWKELEDATRQTVTDYVGVRRTEKGLKLALDTLHALARREPTLKADDLHGLMRIHESQNIRMNAEIMATASLARQETRTGSAHWRLDFPQTDDTNWRKFVVVERGDAGPVTRTLPTNQALSDAFARNQQTV
jgi:succinate dehydrogenase/fumarate reductase flavoprotein subunit